MRRLAATIEQLDLALEHLGQGDPNNARFALMLIDNLMEISLHNYAVHKRREHEARYRYRDTDTPLDPLLRDALNRNFDPKVKYAHTTGLIREDEMRSISILHEYRNEVYHIGLMYEAVLASLASFYFGLCSSFLIASVPNGYSYGVDTKLPERALQYFRNERGHFMHGLEQYKSALETLRTNASEVSSELQDVLAGSLYSVINETDTHIDIVANDAPHKTSRDEAVVGSQAWPFAFTDEGRKYAKENGCPAKNILQQVEWIQASYPWPVKNDPIERWRRRAESVETERDKHVALKKYRDFLVQTENIRALLLDAAFQVEQEIDMQIQRARGN